ncbi:MAG TPA: iron ABC transporter permease, partial [Trueperaceae bacterium]|nr:iron ABC transporter permease [Trueperaceae bacterium]
LADPGIVGIHAGAGVGVMLLLVLPVSVREASALAQPVAAFVGAGAAALLVYGFAFKDGGVTATRLLLVGVGVAAGLSAVMLLLALRMNDQVFAYAVAWQSGSVAGKGWAPIRVLAPLLAALVPLALLQARRLDVLGFGRDVATGLGVAVERQRLGLLALSVGLSASAVALAGSISFVGLIAPHMARSIVGPRHANLLPSAALLGGLLVLVADTAGRTLFGTTELPAGVMVAAVGAPYFLYLLGRSKA